MSVGLNAQTLQERLAKKLLEKTGVAKKMEDKSKASMMKFDPKVSQSDVAIKWEDKEYEKYKSDVRNSTGEKVKVRIGKKNGKVNSIWLGTLEYKADEFGKSDFVRFYKTTGGGHYKVVFSENKILVFTTDLSGYSRAKYFLNNRGTYDEVKAAAKYVKEAKASQQSDLDAYAKNAKANADKAYAEKEAKWSIKDKKVSKIEITDLKAAHSKGYYRSFSFQIKATLSNGKTISTKDGGFWSDYKVTYANADVKNKTIQDTRFVKGDKVIITIKSKFDSKILATADLVMDYSESLTMNFNSNNWGKSGSPLKIEAKQRKHAVTGKDVIMIKVTDLTGYAKPKYMIIDANQSLIVWSKGSNGYKTVGNGNDTGPGANAGNGGDVTVYKDPSVTSLTVEYTANGGTGGAGTYGYNRGRDGRDGKYKEVVRAVNF